MLTLAGWHAPKTMRLALVLKVTTMVPRDDAIASKTVSVIVPGSYGLAGGDVLEHAHAAS